MAKRLGDPSFGGPANYRIVVQGAVPETWRDRLAGMTILVTETAGGNQQTALEGRLRDQAELNGVLESLYKLHLTILDVKALDEPGG
jgi:hypothetical protein